MTSSTSTTSQISTRAKVLSGVVVSTKMKDTAVVAVTRYVKHAKYKKYLKRVKKYLAHDQGNERQVGDKVMIKETRPLSKRKHFEVIKS